MKMFTPYVLAAMLWGACESTKPNPNASLVPAEVFDAMMWKYQTNGVPDTIQLGVGTYLTRGNPAWWLAAGDSLVGAGMDSTVIRRMDPQVRFVVNGWTIAGNAKARIADLTVDANATLVGKEAACGVGGLHWKDSVIERVRVIGLGSFSLPSESFGIILEDCTNSVIRDCVVEKNVGGYVSAYTISGKRVTLTNNAANFTWKPGWDTRLQAFCVAGMGPGGSADLTVAGNRTRNARFAIFGDTGSKIDRLALVGNQAKLRNDPEAPASYIRLTGEVRYLNVKNNHHRLRVGP